MNTPTTRLASCAIVSRLRFLFATIGLLAVCGCRANAIPNDITPKWWRELPGEHGFEDWGWRDPVVRAAVLLLPWGISLSIFWWFRTPDNHRLRALKAEGFGTFLGATLFYLYGGVVALTIIEGLLLAAFSYAIHGSVHWFEIPFLLFVNLCIVVAVAMAGLAAVCLRLIGTPGVLKRGLGLIGIVLEGFGIIFTLRDVWQLLQGLF